MSDRRFLSKSQELFTQKAKGIRNKVFKKNISQNSQEIRYLEKLCIFLQISDHTFKMAAALDTGRKQRAVIELLFLEGENAANVHKRLVNIYIKISLDVSKVRQVISINGNPQEKEEIEV